MQQTDVMALSTAFLIVLGLLAVVVVGSGFRRVGASERLVVRRFGRTAGVRGPGPRFLLPFVDEGVRVPVDEQSYDLWFRATTGDGVPVRVRAVVGMEADDPVRYASAADVPSSAAQAAAEVALRDAVARRDLADLPSLMDAGDDADLVRRVDEAVRPWGMGARRVAIVDATVPVRAAPPPRRPAEHRPAEHRRAEHRATER
ncbi:MAG TPA: SPFH domain-containing protein [Spirillospora sp.]